MIRRASSFAILGGVVALAFADKFPDNGTTVHFTARCMHLSRARGALGKRVSRFAAGYTFSRSGYAGVSHSRLRKERTLVDLGSVNL